MGTATPLSPAGSSCLAQGAQFQLQPELPALLPAGFTPLKGSEVRVIFNFPSEVALEQRGLLEEGIPPAGITRCSWTALPSRNHLWEAKLWDFCTPGICLEFLPPSQSSRRSDSPQEMLLISLCCSGITTVLQFPFSSSNHSMAKLAIRVIVGEFRAPPGTGAQVRSPHPQEEAKCCN